MKTILLILAGSLISFLLSVVWWRLWMYKGFFGPPAFLSAFLWTDGEASYDRVALEMFLVLFVIFSFVILAFRYKEHFLN